MLRVFWPLQDPLNTSEGDLLPVGLHMAISSLDG